MATAAVLQRLQQRAIQADQLIVQLKTQLGVLRKAAVTETCNAEAEKLRSENAALHQAVEQAKQNLIAAEVKNGVQQVLLRRIKPVTTQVTASPTKLPVETKPDAAAPKSGVVVSKSDDKKANLHSAGAGERQPKKTSEAKKDARKEAKENVKDSPKPTSASDSSEKVDVSRLNMRIGRIVNVQKHPDADSLYMEEVDVGETKPRTIVSGLVKHVPLEQMQNRLAVFLLNLKAAKMRGVMSEGMIMCASSPEKVEIIVPPEGAQVGDQVTVEGYPGTPDEQLNPKKKTWEQIQPDLRIDERGMATYKGALWAIPGKGHFKAPTMTNAPIK